MQASHDTATLTREVIGTLIPAGTKVELPAGALAMVTQALGGSYTVQVEGHLFRIEGKDADAIGRQVDAALSLSADAGAAEIESAVWQQLKSCYDPEIPINIVDLGLIYECRLQPRAEKGWKVQVRMTLTAPGCGMGEVLVSDVREKALRVPGVGDAEVDLVFDPPWTREMMSEEAQLQAGFI